MLGIQNETLVILVRHINKWSSHVVKYNIQNLLISNPFLLYLVLATVYLQLHLTVSGLISQASKYRGSSKVSKKAAEVLKKLKGLFMIPKAKAQKRGAEPKVGHTEGGSHESHMEGGSHGSHMEGGSHESHMEGGSHESHMEGGSHDSHMEGGSHVKLPQPVSLDDHMEMGPLDDHMEVTCGTRQDQVVP